jgi:hypothetical protein
MFNYLRLVDDYNISFLNKSSDEIKSVEDK